MAALVTKNYTWNQGEDGVMRFTFKRGESQATATPVDLTEWSLRMDIGTQTTPSIYTFNTNDGDPLTEDEAVLGSDGSITITVPRSVTLPAGTLGGMLSSQNVFNYDIFLRDDNDKQFKFASGTVTVEKSVTLWA